MRIKVEGADTLAAVWLAGALDIPLVRRCWDLDENSQTWSLDVERTNGRTRQALYDFQRRREEL